MAKYLIINADDFGLTEAVNRGIVEAYIRGCVSSTSMMVNMPGLEDALKHARSLPALGIGLHFNLTYGFPLADPKSVSSLIRDDGSFRIIGTAALDEERHIEAELQAQWQCFIRTGMYPTHLDAHHLLHQHYPAVYRVMSRFAAREGVPMRTVQRTDLRTNLDALDVRPLMTDRIILDTYHALGSLARILHYLQALDEGTTELTCHPGYSDHTLQALSDWTKMRELELAVLCRPEIRKTIYEQGIQLITYRSLRRCRQPLASPARQGVF
ncbi:carbohydrate deacetylase [Paenibacillus sp. GCM10012307]|uniref:ChbG/HpnK family deacetylase n=1 Tax=Paenibacillus roseus TaxID=2798579 RepID=A0A934MTQ5_9BACL|nr:ChbG/HpnK family deacetylase [Paenibacillus roseus]MBJ6360297.1 ChbG/HpnK family deacetylase [Paenibacillus roseus]